MILILTLVLELLSKGSSAIPRLTNFSWFHNDKWDSITGCSTDLMVNERQWCLGSYIQSF